MRRGRHVKTAMRVLCALALVAVAGAVTTCGGDSKPGAAGSAAQPLVGKRSPQSPTGRSNEAQAPGSEPQAGAGEQPTGQDALSTQRAQLRPCSLVSRARAQAILGEPIKAPLEAPQGPTCIYRAQHGKRFTTLAVQSLRFSQLKSQIRRPRRIDVSGRSAVCGSYGQPILYVPLSGGRVLSVAAQCPVARQFAIAAVSRLAG